MKTILCPVDFTASSDRVAKYAAQLAHDTHAKVILVAAHPKKARVPAGDWPEGRSEVMDRLGELHDLLTSMYHIPCGIEEEVISDKIIKKLSTAADHYDLLLLGVASGKDGIPKETNGTNLVRMIQETLVPLYVVPDKFVYQKINTLVYAYDYKHEPDAPMMTLHWLAEWFDAEMKFVSVLQSNISVKEKDRINEIRHTLDTQWKTGKKLSFETIVHDDPPKGLEQYMDMQGNNHMLVLSVDHQNMLDRIWHKSVVKRIVKYASHPYMIIHK